MDLRRFLFVCALAWGTSATAQANAQPIPEPPPPPAGAVDDPALEPEVTIRQRGQDKVEEYRIHGRLYMIKVTPKGGVPYYLVDQKGDGVFARYDGMDTGLKVPRWIIKSW